MRLPSPIPFVLVVAAALALASCSGGDAVPDGRPRPDKTSSLFGTIWPEETIVGGGGGVGWAQEAIANFRRVSAADAPARVEPLDTSSCVMKKPAAGDLVRHVIVGRGAGAAPLYQIDAARGRADAAADQLRLVNIVVTEKSAPVHLVLASESNVVWNILAAADTRIAAITAISGGGVGVAGAPEGVAIEAIYGEALTRCGVTPARQPQNDWALVRRAAKAAAPERAYLADRRQAADAYDAWFAKWYGAAPGAQTIAQFEIGAALVGPAPASKADRVPMRPLSGATLKLSLADRLIIGAPRDYEAAAARRAEQAGS